MCASPGLPISVFTLDYNLDLVLLSPPARGIEGAGLLNEPSFIHCEKWLLPDEEKVCCGSENSHWHKMQ
jgi:hypothetical protein